MIKLSNSDGKKNQLGNNYIFQNHRNEVLSKKNNRFSSKSNLIYWTEQYNG